MSKEAWVDEVLRFWFGELTPEDWYASRPELDGMIRERFLSLHERLAAALPAEAWGEPDAALAAIVALDQFPRNMFRGEARAFATDAQAAALSRNAFDKGFDEGLSPERRQFLAMPLMHSEALADQERCVGEFKELGNAEGLAYAEEHRDIIARFGRFPHRNRALGRPSTADERAFMEEHKGYGQ